MLSWVIYKNGSIFAQSSRQRLFQLHISHARQFRRRLERSVLCLGRIPVNHAVLGDGSTKYIVFDVLLQLLPLQIPFHSCDSGFSREPEIHIIRPSPRKILDSEIRLNSHNQGAIFWINNINTCSSPSNC